MDLKQIKRNRFLFLEKVYKESNGDTQAMFDMFEVGAELNFDRSETEKIVEYLRGEDLLEARALGGIIGLTHWGLKEVEEAIENPDRATEHFLPVNIINIGTMTNSTLQQATVNSTISVQFDSSKSVALDDILDALDKIQNTLIISNDLQKELTSEVQTIKIQKDSPRPKNVIIVESLKTIRTILESVAGNAATPFIIEQITRLVG